MAAMTRMTIRPRPSLQIPETCRPNRHVVIQPDDRERRRSTRFARGQSGVDVLGDIACALRNWTPLIKRRLRSRGRYQAVCMATIQRFEASMRPRHNKIKAFNVLGFDVQKPSNHLTGLTATCRRFCRGSIAPPKS